MKNDARITPGEPVDDGGDEACRERGGGSDPHFAGGRVGEEFDVLHALPQLIEGGMAAVEHGAPVLGEFDAARVSLKQSHAEGVLQVADRARDDRVGDGEWLAAFAMLPDCATASRMCRSLSLIRRPIRSFQRMVVP